jgi:icmO
MSEIKRFEGIRRDQEIHKDEKIRDTRSVWKKIGDSLKSSPKIYVRTMYVLVVLMTLFPFSMDFVMFIGSLFSIIIVKQGKARTLLFRTPMSSGTVYRKGKGPKEFAANGKEKKNGASYDKDGKELDGIYFFGNDVEFDNEEFWFNDSDVRKHMLLFGTTGAGKTEALLSLCYGALITCSGFIYSDGKGTFELYYKVFATCRSLGAEDDLLLMSFLTGDEDPTKATTIKISNDLNPFADSPKDASVQLLVSLMSSSQGGDDMWKERASVLMESVIGLLVYRRDFKKILISVDSIRDALILENIYKAWKNAQNIQDENHPDFLPPEVLKSLNGYLVSLPGFDMNKDFSDQPDTINEQHGYLFMQFTKLLGSLADMYGYIFNTQLSEINFWDVVVHRRVLVVLLPALAKSKNELSMLGKIIIACIKQMMTSGLGKKSEGNLREILNANPTKSRTPFIVILDEYGYYSVPGAAVMPAQARGLGFFMIFAGQDFAAFAATSKEEAESIVANCKIQICMALQDEKQTYEIFSKKAGEAEISVTTGKEYKDSGFLRENRTVNIEKRARITFKDLSEQESGYAHFVFEGKLGRGRFFYVAIDNEMKDKDIRVNQFIKVEAPTLEKVQELTEEFELIKQKLTNVQYIATVLEEEDAEGQDEVLTEISELFNDYRKEHNDSTTMASCATIAHICFNKKKLIDESKARHSILTNNKYQTSFVKDDEDFDEQHKQFEDDKKDFNKQEIPPYGRRNSDMRDDILRKQMVVNRNATIAESESRSQLDMINIIARYPRQAPEIKRDSEILNYIKDFNDAITGDYDEDDEDGEDWFK